LYTFINTAGVESLYPTTNNIAAKLDKGIRFKSLGAAITETNNNILWNKAGALALPPDWMFAELLTIT